jgi:hypothetical protein
MIMIDEHPGFIVRENFVFIILLSTLCPINVTLLLRYIPMSGVFDRCTITFILYRDVGELCTGYMVRFTSIHTAVS